MKEDGISTINEPIRGFLSTCFLRGYSINILL